MIVSTYLDKQEILSGVAGFYAPDKRELSESLTVISSRDTVGVGQHLNEIYRHQQTIGAKNPYNAVATVVREYITNYRSSLALTKQLGGMALWIADIPNPRLTLLDETITINSGHQAFIRYCDLRDVYSNKAVDNSAIEEVLERPYFSKNKETLKYISERLGQITIKMARHTVRDSIQDQKNRTSFWLDTLQQIKSHRIAGPIVKSAAKADKR